MKYPSKYPPRFSSKKSITEKLLSVLEREAGKTVKEKELLALMRTAKTGENRKERRKGEKREKTPENERLVHILLAELELLGLCKIEGKSVQIKKPFALNATLSMSPGGTAFAVVEGADRAVRDTFISRQHTMSALPGDKVLIQLLDKKRERFEGRILKVINRARETYRVKLLSQPNKNGVLGTLLDTPGNVTVCVLTDRIPHDTRNKMKTDIIVYAELTGNEIRHPGGYFPSMEFTGIEDTGPETDFRRILMKYNYNPVYPANVPLPPTDEEPEKKNVSDWDDRKDLRGLYTVTIDGETAKDFDDALSLEPRKSSKWKLYVHIADVSHYVTPDSILDKEALSRSTSVYMADRVVPMLPPALSENLCSLVAEKNRLAFTCEMEINPKTGKIASYDFYKSIIRVDRRLTYEIAEEEIDREIKKPSDSPSMLSMLLQLALIQKEQRIKKGRIDLDIPETKFISGPGDTGGAVKIRTRLKSSILIEECMLSANICAAELLKKKKANVLYRIHEPINESKLETLNSFFDIYNVECRLKDSTPASIQKALAAVNKHPRADIIGHIFNIILLRSFMQAKYSGEPVGHWGLGFPDYCHFTSPIRRYPDLVVHRVIHRLTTKKKALYAKEDVISLGFHTSDKERRAMNAERDMLKLKLIRFLEASGKKEFKGFITGFKYDRIFVELEDPPVEGIISAHHVTNESELVIPNDFSVYIKKLSRPAFLGERLKLELERAEPEELNLYFKPIWEKNATPLF